MYAKLWPLDLGIYGGYEKLGLLGVIRW